MYEACRVAAVRDRVTAHSVEVEGQSRPKTTILMKFDASVMARESRMQPA